MGRSRWGPGGEKLIFPEVSKKCLYDVFKVFGGHLRVRSGILRYFEYRLGGEGGAFSGCTGVKGSPGTTLYTVVWAVSV